VLARGAGGLVDDSPAVLQLDADSFPAPGSGWLYLVSAVFSRACSVLSYFADLKRDRSWWCWCRWWVGAWDTHGSSTSSGSTRAAAVLARGPGALFDDSPAVLQLDADSFPAAGSGWLYLVRSSQLHCYLVTWLRYQPSACAWMYG
jgi:hypothetical protein